jgi:predicted tellurium resistance membrane protein TerC
VLRILFASIATQLLGVLGLILIGGFLLLWVCWKMWRELRTPHHAEQEAIEGKDLDGDGKIAGNATQKKTLAQAVMQIVVADVSMSLDNVLAVAGAAHDHPWILVFGLANMMRGGSPNTSQKLMRLRVIAQFVTIVLVMGALYLRSQ